MNKSQPQSVTKQSNEIDLDLKNYTYQDFLNLFRVNINKDTQTLSVSNVEQIERTLQTVEDNLTENYISFYKMASKIIYVVDNLIHNNTPALVIDCYVNYLKDPTVYLDLETLSIQELIDLVKINISNTSSLGVILSHSKKTTSTILNNNDITNKIDNPPEELNGIKRPIRHVHLNINTAFRMDYENTLSSDYKYTLPTEIKNVVSMKLVSVVLPNTWFLISNYKHNNYLQIKTINSGIESTYNITMANGYYDNVTMPLYLNNTFFNLSGTSTDLQYITFSVDNTSYVSIFSTTGVVPIGFSFSVIFYDPDKHICMSNRYNSRINDVYTLGWIMGFRMKEYKNITNSISSEGMFDAAGNKYIYLAINDYQYSTNFSNIICLKNSIIDKQILGKIPILNGKMAILFEQNDSMNKGRVYNGPITLKTIHISLLDEFGNIVSLNNMDFSFTLDLETLYEFDFKNSHTL